ncbi:MAG: TVP38/TMEM64 family protein [Nitrospina sp.]|jgi:uncharacterized membrane protein YdjX (TVP38/TMEM64 family)|nr:TVP38/TMEM64 family protein [Nitrospina sp.]MBT3414424.1 TVP38/TMEM64 family protein [Nitrospina sp.]MBT3855744.1 TVP38/TMEM64 family protein [Nitrospina sp.]MBT4104964.1 TVP38/TMEM64 family protein [Nitrospina sp.]MBT4390220.1 TVP38/TMEM64 family protein [Nitrospina sp.]
MKADADRKLQESKLGDPKRVDPKKRFIQFALLILVGGVLSYWTLRRGVNLTPESFRDYIFSLDVMGPVIFLSLFIVRPLLLIPSIMLFIAGGLAFGPFWGPLYASIGAVLGGSLGFWIARKMGHDFVMSKLKLGKGVIQKTRFNSYVVFFLSFLPVMPVTVINYGAGLSRMSFKSYILAHALGITPRAFAYGYFGNSLLEIGSPRFNAAILILIIMGLLTIYLRKIFFSTTTNEKESIPAPADKKSELS